MDDEKQQDQQPDEATPHTAPAEGSDGRGAQPGYDLDEGEAIEELEKQQAGE